MKAKVDPLNINGVIEELDALIGLDFSADMPTLQSEPPALEARIKAKKVLVVDDSDDYRDIVRFLLKKQGYEVIEASNGVEGLGLAVKEQPDLILLDFNMPLMNGYELLQELRVALEKRTPVIMFTGATNRKQLQEMGMDIDAFLQKPVTNAQLLEAVAASLKDSPGSRPAVGAHDKAGASPAAGAAPMSEHDEAANIPDLESIGAEDADDGIIVDVEPEKEEEEEESGLELLANESPLVKKVNCILVQAVGLGASDIHIEPQETAINVRIRLNGSLKPLCTLPLNLTTRLSARIKIMASLVITERRRPQDGQFRVMIAGKKVEFRVSTIPSLHGEKIVMRILGTSKIKARPEEMGMPPRDLECVERAVQSPHGLILVTGPTGSGKTTTLYSMISMLNKPDVNIMTAEDPVEYQLPGINQISVKPAIGLTFESVLRSFLRQDPDVMLVGEVRDLETAEIAVKASITGHLVLSTLHTNSAPATITRLTHMGLPPFMVSASIRLVIAQRLVKLLCPSCKLETQASDEESRLLSDEELGRLGQAYRSVGCKECKQTGYSGRKPIFEVMPVRSAAMRNAILQSAGEDSLTALAVGEGMTGLRHAAVDAVARGETSLSEALKIILSE